MAERKDDPKPAIPPPPAPDDIDEEDEGRENAGHQRLWDSPIGAGDPIPFDPTKFKPPMSKEEIEKILKGEGP